MSSVLYINKPKGISSFDVCYKLRKVLNTTKIGHTGTLDPNATGVMIVLYNKSCKASQFLLADTKEYKTRVLLGKQTDTLDIDGNVISESDFVIPDRNTLIDVLDSFKGKSKQKVPLTSAKKVNGKRLYQYQLKNIEVELPVIDINIEKIKLDEIYDDGFSFTCRVSSGTYIRSLVQDILDKLSLKGTVLELCRTMINDISISDCDELDDVINGKYTSHELIDVISKRYSIYNVDNKSDILNGKRIKIDSDEEYLAIVNNNDLLAIYKKAGLDYKCIRGLW